MYTFYQYNKLFFLLFLILAPFFTHAQTNNTLGGLAVSPSKVFLEIIPGEKKVGELYYQNNSITAVDVTFFVERFESETDTIRFIAKNQDTDPEATSNWLQVNKENLTFNPGETTIVPYTLSIPLDAQSGGKYLGIVTRAAFEQDNQSTPTSSTQLAYELVSLFFITVKGEEAHSDLRLVSFKPTTSTSEVLFTTILENQGTVHEVVKGSLAINNLFGKTVATVPFNEKKQVVLPQGIVAFENTWNTIVKKQDKDFIPYLALGPYTATLSVAGQEGNELISTRTSFVIFPWWSIVVLIVLVVILLWLGAIVRKKYLPKKA